MPPPSRACLAVASIALLCGVADAMTVRVWPETVVRRAHTKADDFLPNGASECIAYAVPEDIWGTMIEHDGARVQHAAEILRDAEHVEMAARAMANGGQRRHEQRPISTPIRERNEPQDQQQMPPQGQPQQQQYGGDGSFQQQMPPQGQAQQQMPPQRQPQQQMPPQGQPQQQQYGGDGSFQQQMPPQGQAQQQMPPQGQAQQQMPPQGHPSNRRRRSLLQEDYEDTQHGHPGGYSHMTPQQIASLREEAQPAFDRQGHADVAIEVGFVVSDKDGKAASKAQTTVQIIAPDGKVLEQMHGVENEAIVAHARGGPGPYRLCFSYRGSGAQPLLVDVSYFTVSLIHIPNAVFGFGIGMDDEHSETVPEHIATDEFLQASDLHAIAVSAHSLKSVIGHVRLEQRHLRQKDHRKWLTAQAGHSRALWYGLLVNAGIVAASAVQVMRIRSMFDDGGGRGGVPRPAGIINSGRAPVAPRV